MIATLLFEISKSAFALFFINFPVYKVIYGALAVIPLLFIWVFISWVVVLVGAQIAAVLMDSLKSRKIFLIRLTPCNSNAMHNSPEPLIIISGLC
ncbi:MAG: hypothetical protein CM1200mP30_34030 [Pseudomonadota bacterium]|nr:MAG: hypothetical protein CM1200mP30_34030 [Pseudomonadota bacterium]